MLIVLILLGVVAAGLAVALMLSKQSASEFRAQADERERALLVERDDLNRQVADLDRALATAKGEVSQLKKEAVQAEAETRRITSERDHARVQNSELEGRVESQATELAAEAAAKNDLQSTLIETEQDLREQRSSLATASGALATATEELAAAKAATAEAEAATLAAKAETEVATLAVKAEAEAQIAEIEARHSAAIEIGEEVRVGAANPANLWDLEVARSERTWRTSVATNPEAEQTPFETAEDPVRLAVEIEAAALRENVGAFITIEWEAAPISDPARRHLIVRVAQEMLEVAARNREPSRLVVSGDDEIGLRLLSADDDEVVSIVPPRVVTDLIDVREETGLNVTVKAASD